MTRRCFNTKAFTLIEVVIALAIVATGLLAIVGLIPLGLEASRDSGVRTITAIILEDVHDRLEGQRLRAGPLPNSPYYYDGQGLFIDTNGATADKADPSHRKFRVDARLVDLDSQSLPADVTGLKGVVLDLSWPVDPASGEAMGNRNPKSSISYYLTTLTGPDWEKIDSTYKAKIEF